MPKPFTIADIIMALETANAALFEADKFRQLQDDLPGADTAYTQIVELCADIERAVTSLHHLTRNKQRELRRRPRTEQEMITIIAKEIDPMRKHRKPSTKEIMSGGKEAAALRRAEGKCELCGAEWGLAAHHVTPRKLGGLDELENIVVVCKDCHNEIELQALPSRAETLHYMPQRKINLELHQEQEKKTIFDLTPAEKAAITKKTNHAEEAKRAAEIAEWARPFDKYLDASVQILPLDAPRIERPEKSWHVIVYGAGRNSNLLRKGS